jgi:calcium binding protein 39
MKRFINNMDNLKLIMNLLLDKHKNIQFEAFHVFKVFVANPHKSDEIKKILYMNKAKLIRYLNKFNPAASDDQFVEEKALVIGEIEKIERPTTMNGSTETATVSSSGSASDQEQSPTSKQEQQDDKI